jgi:hypothetical protein
MHTTHQFYRNQLDECLTTLQKIDDIVLKSSLWKFYNNLRFAWVALDTEMIQCRRRGKVTPKYTELAEEFTAHYKNFEHWQILAVLMN